MVCGKAQFWLLASMLACSTVPSSATQGRPAPARALIWTTLGTAGGPSVQADRSQPANLLDTGQSSWMIDCGDGASERLADAGLNPAQIDTVFISHLHIDHTAGLMGLIGLRWFTRAPHVLTIYGPPGTDQIVAGIVQSLEPAQRIGIGIRGPAWVPSVASTVEVRIIKDGADLTVGGVHVRAVKNTHFADKDGRDDDNGSQSLSFRFEKAGYSIGYTGDTGPSVAVEQLVRGADLLVSETIDLKPLAAEIYRRYPEMPEPAKRALVTHFERQHLTPAEAGKLAADAGAKRLVLTHLTALGKTAEFAPRLAAEARTTFHRDVVIARDLDRF